MTAPATTTAGAPSSAPASPTNAQPTRATFTNVSPGGSSGGASAAVPVHFNPVSLQIALANTLEEKAEGQSRTQYVSRSSAKLTMDLIFDTTDTGADVRNATRKVAAFMEASGPDDAHRTPPTVLFEWGTFKFQGLFESYRETIDFFSHDGVPLRASVNLTMASQTVVFADNGPTRRTSAVDLPPNAGNASQIASQGGNPNAGRNLAAANGLESMRFSTGPLTVNASVKLGAAAAFSSGAKAGAGAGVGAGIGIGAGASVGVGVSGPSFGGSASAGLSATQGAFAGLRMGSSTTGPALDPSRLVPRPQPSAVDAGPQASFGIGGQASATGSASLGTDVGATASTQSGLRFDGA
jgi:hypothetical protein